MPDWFGAHRIPTSFDAGTTANIGVAMILADGSLRLTPLSSVQRSCTGAPEGRYLIDPANNGQPFWADCTGDSETIIHPQYDSYSTYYATCGGAADSDCTPTCDDGCTMEKQSGASLGDCCDDSSYASLSQYQSVNIIYEDAIGFAIQREQLEALVDLGIDTTDSRIKVWFFDATDQVTLPHTLFFIHLAPVVFIIHLFSIIRTFIVE